MDQYPPGSMTSTHTGNPVCAAAALASLKKIVGDDLAGNAARMEPLMMDGLRAIQARHPRVIGNCTGRGLVCGVADGQAGSEGGRIRILAFDVVERCFHKGLLFFAPVGSWGQTVKISPPLTINEEAVAEGLAVLGESVDEGHWEVDGRKTVPNAPERAIQAALIANHSSFRPHCPVETFRKPN